MGNIRDILCIRFSRRKGSDTINLNAELFREWASAKFQIAYRQQCIDAQRRYCEARELPHFAPSDGICYSCGRDIYAKGGVTAEEAGSRLITGCPFCLRTYVD